MQLSLSWLKEFVNMPKNMTAEKFGELLTLHTVEVEGIKTAGQDLQNIYVGKIINIEKHPNADKLKLVTVDLSQGKYKVVCGGTNLYSGMIVAFAKVGSRIKWHGQGDLVTLEPAVIRGEKSEGMICAAIEIGLEDVFPADNDSAVIDLPQDYKVGKLLAQELRLDDVIFDIDNKSMTHRPDLWGHYGMARDVSAWLKTPLKSYQITDIRTGKDNFSVDVKDTKDCPRYMAVALKNITIKTSPDWLQKKLLTCGLRPINNIVDITNYVMLELGQPTHAFDASKLKNGIVVRKAKAGEKINTLDGQERKLDKEALVITDGQKPIAIAGIMGGANSAINEHTKEIIIESANFNPVSIRKTSQKLSLRTDASQRFEKSLDPNLCETALKKIISLIQESCPEAVVSSQIKDIKNFSLNQKAIKLDVKWVEQKIGVKLSEQEIKNILESLGFEVSGQDVLSVISPSWRATKDIAIAEDLVEEVARIYGYNKIEPAMPVAAINRPAVNKQREFRDNIKDFLVRAGMNETYNYSFVNEEQLDKLNFAKQNYIKLANPLTKEHTLLRRSLLPCLLENIVVNQRNFEVIKLFEFGNVFLSEEKELYKDDKKKEKMPKQTMMLGLVYAKDTKTVGQNFRALKGILAFLADELGIEFDFVQNKFGVDIKLKKNTVGSMKIIDEKTAAKFGIKINAVSCELQVSLLQEARKEKKYHPKNKFPYLIRDMAFVVDKKILYNDIKREILTSDSLIVNVEVFDVYEGENISDDQKSVAMHITFGSEEKTLIGEEVDKIQQVIVNNLEKKFKARLRNF